MKLNSACPRRSYLLTSCVAAILAAAGAPVDADTWPMKHRDPQHTGRSDFVVPAARLNDSLLDIIRWQKPSPGSPNEGNLDSSSMVFHDGTGPDGHDLVAAGYHWPKGVQGMDRQTGRCFWSGNPEGGESIGTITPAFSNDGTVLYVTNDATSHPLMAFLTATGPSTYWHNGGDPNPEHLGAYSPVVAADGRVFSHAWCDRPYAAADYGTYLSETWAASSGNCTCFNNPGLYVDGSQLLVITSGRCGDLRTYAGDSGLQLWSTSTGQGTDADVTIDPANGNIYVPAGSDSIYVVGVNKSGVSLWTSTAKLVFQWISGANEPQRVASAGCLSHDGATFYFQTVGNAANGRLYAVNTSNGSVKWSFPTGSNGWELWASSPVVTPNGVVIVGNNNGTYYAIHDDGSQGTLVDTLVTAGSARASATLSSDGRLYLPLRTTWTTSNGDGDIPTFQTENVYTCLDLNEGAATILPPPPGQLAVALNHAVNISWQAIPDPTGQFDHYAIYRSTAPFDAVSAMTPVGTVDDLNTVEYLDATAQNGVSYYFGVTTVSLGGGEQMAIQSTGPRTPRDETDLQIMCISRAPRYPRYLPEYTYYEVTEPSGFGPYVFSAATGLGGGQTSATQRWPNLNDPVTYTATIRNCGTNPVNGTLGGNWRVDGGVVSSPLKVVSLAPGATATFAYVMLWDDQHHEVQFTLNFTDAHSENNEVSVFTKSAPFLTYVDVGFIEDFREVSTPSYPQAATADMIDWLQRHAAEMNRMFVEAGSLKRVHYDLLAVTRDGDPDPGIDTTPFGIFPFRYYGDQWGDPRSPGYYHADVDIDYGLCHELSHQLGLVDIYQLDLPAEWNQVSSMGYSAVACLMHGCSLFYSEHSAGGMSKWVDIVHGYYGQYMYDIPAEIRLRMLDYYGDPLSGATVTMYQLVERPGIGKVISNQVKAQGTTNEDGEWTLPNVPIDPALVPPTDAGVLYDNPFGYLAVVGTNGVLHFKVEYDEFVDYAWLDITEANVAYWQGQTDLAVFERQVPIGGQIQFYPPADMTEMNAVNWSNWTQDGAITLSNDQSFKHVGQASLKGLFTGGFDNYIRYPSGILAKWDLSNVTHIRFWAYAINPNGGFQNSSPWVRLGSYQNGYFQWTPSWDILNTAIGQWREFVIPIGGDATWTRTAFGTPSFSQMNYLQIHADTWGSGFTLWFDGVRFAPNPEPSAGDMNCDTQVDMSDVPLFVTALIEPAEFTGCDLDLADISGDGTLDGRDLQGFVELLLMP